MTRLITFYTSLMTLCAPAWKVVGFWRRWRGKECPKRLPERFGKPSAQRPQGPVIWFHGASVGEGRSALSIIQQLLEDWPQLWVVLTSQTSGAARALPPSLPSRVIHQMAPYDVPSFIHEFLDYWQPKAFVVLEAEMWPSTWHAISQSAIPMFLFNFHISAKSSSRWRHLRSFFQAHYALFQARWSGCSASYERFCQLAPSLPMTLMPSLKYASPLLKCPPGKPFDLGGRLAWLASCVHSPEEDLIFNTHLQLLKEIPDLLLLYAPRHIDRIAILEKKILDQKWSFQKRSVSPALLPETQIYLIDTMGELAAFYTVCPFVVLCGSFCNVGGHNIIEPTVLGCGVIHGPLMANNKDIAEDFQRHQAAIQVEPQNLCSAVLKWIRCPEEARQVAEKGKQVVESSRKELDLIVKQFSQDLGRQLNLVPVYEN